MFDRSSFELSRPFAVVNRHGAIIARFSSQLLASAWMLRRADFFELSIIN
jgi:hypothetical protein